MVRNTFTVVALASCVGLLAPGLAGLPPAGSRGLGTAGLGAAQAASFPDVPPWHWAYQAVTQDQAAGLVIGYPASPAELIQNSLMQVYDGFVHAPAPGARAWVERFTFNRPADWPGPLGRARLTSFLLGRMSVAVTGEAATAAFDATVGFREAGGVRTVHGPMRVRLRLEGDDWQVDYATLVAGSPVFR